MDHRAPLSWPVDKGAFAGSLRRDCRGLRLGFLGDLGGHLPMEPGVLDLVRDGLKHFEQIGCIVEETSAGFDMEQLWESWVTLRAFLVAGHSRPLYDKAETRALLKLFERYDALVLPTAQLFAFPAETHWPQMIAGKSMDTYHRWMEVVVPASIAGVSALALPCGFDASGRAMGLQLIGKPHADRFLLQLGHAYEHSTGLSQYRP